MQVEISDSDRFLAYAKNYTPEVQIMRYLYLAEAKRPVAEKLIDHFLQLALDNNLIGCYKTIVKKLGANEGAKFLQTREAQQESAAKAVVDLKKHIVSLANGRSSAKEQSQAHLNLANILTGYGEYDQADEQLRRIKDLNELETDQYYPLWVRINMLSLKMDQSKPLVLKLTEANQNTPDIRRYLILQDLREVAEGKQAILSNIVGMGLRSNQLKNEFITEIELGEYYSLLTLASGKRELSKNYLPWSSMLEKNHVRMQYRKLLEESAKMLEKYEFDPWLGRRRNELRQRIRSNMFNEVIRAYKVAKIELIQQELGMTEKDVQRYLVTSSNAEWRYLMDPVTHTVHLAEKNSRLLQNLEGINKILRGRQESILRDKEDDRYRLGIGGLGMAGMGGYGGMDDDDDDYEDDYRARRMH